MRRSLPALFLALFSFSASAGVDFRNYDDAAVKAQWREAAEIAMDLAVRNPSLRAVARVKAAYALFQAGFPNSALSVLGQIPAADWKSIPSGEAKLTEMAVLIQKKVPLAILPGRLDQANPQAASEMIRSEVLFARGRAAFERQDSGEARRWLEQVPRHSRLFAHARYLLGALAVRAGDVPGAEREFSQVFEPSVLQQSTEFWRDVSAQMAENWGGNVRVFLDTHELIAENARLGELAAMGLARAAYMRKDFSGALTYYSRVRPDSRFAARSALERIWTLLALNRHDEAQALAGQLAVDQKRFEALEAKVVRSIVLTDVGRTEEARRELEGFRLWARQIRDGIGVYESTRAEHGLPAFLLTDFSDDKRITATLAYQKDVRDEVDRLRREDARLYPSFRSFAAALEPLVLQARDLNGRLVRVWVEKRKQDLDRLSVQASLVEIETYLEDREQLRREFRSLGQITERQQADHDERLESLLRKVVKNTDELTGQGRVKNLRLEMRHSELLWELGSAVAVLAQSRHDKRLDEEASALRLRAFQKAKEIVGRNPDPTDRARALFFAGYAATELGKEAEGLKLLEEFAAKYSSDAHAPDAFRVLADSRFDKNDFKGAESWYRRIFDHSDSPVLGYAFYKTAWCAYNRKDFARALLALEKAVVWSREARDQSQMINLAREAKRDLVALYAEVGDHRRAYDYFTQFLRGDPREWLGELAQELDRNGQYEKSAEIHRLIVSLNPNDPSSILHQASMVWGAYHLRRWPEATEALQVLADRFSGEAAVAGSGTPSAAAEELVREAALAREFEYRKAPSDPAAESVEKIYSLYLRVFGDWGASQEPRFRYGLFLRGRKKNLEAETELRRHWEQFSGTLKEPAREEALRNWIDVIRDLDRPEDREGLLVQAEAYRKSYPKSKHSRSVAFLIPATLFKAGRADDAVHESQSLFDADPSDEIGRLCFKNLRVAYYDRKDWAATRSWAERLLERAGPSMKPYRDDLMLIQEESSFLEAESAATPAEQAAIYARVAKSFPRLREKSVVNGFISFKAAGKNLAALELAESGGNEIRSISGIRAALYQEAGDYARAIPLLEDFVKSPPEGTAKEPIEEARRNIALIRGALAAKPAVPETRKALAPALLAKKARVEKGLVGGQGDLAAQIERGTAAFQSIVEEFLAIARDSASSPEVAFEAYCAVPLLYRSHAQAVRAVAARPEFAKEREALSAELEKISAPLDGKAAEFAAECLAKTEEAGTAGRFYADVAGFWGGTDRARRIQSGAILLSRLSAQSPWLENPSSVAAEADLVRAHLDGKGDGATWHALALHRLRAKTPGLARLTAADGLSRFPAHGALWNVQGAAHQALGELKEAEAAFRKGVAAGSAHASVNLGIIELGRGRIEAARDALSHGAFQGAPELEKLVEEFLR